MLRTDATTDALHARQEGTLPGLYGLRVTRLAEGALDAELDVQPWMLAPNGFLHAASVLLLADTAAGYACISHLPEGAKTSPPSNSRATSSRPRARAGSARNAGPSTWAAAPMSGRPRSSAPATSAWRCFAARR